MNHHDTGLGVRVALADALLANVSAQLDREAVDAVIDCGFSSTLAAVRNRYPLLDFDEYPGQGSL